MKKIIFVFIISIGFNFIMYSQPSDAVVKKRAMDAGAIETLFTADHGNIHTSLTEKWYIRTMESKWKTDEPGVYRWERNEYRYNYVGGSWSYARIYSVANWFEGIPNPTEEEIVETIYKDLPKFLGHFYNKGVGDLPQIKLSDEPRWNWHTFNSVSFNVEYDITYILNNFEIRKEHVVSEVRFYRNTGNNAHDPNIRKIVDGEWLPGGLASKIDNLSTVIETTKLSREEMKGLKTFAQLNQEREAEEALAKLGTLDVPEFSTPRELIAYTIDMMHTAEPNELELYFRKVFTSGHYYDGGIILTKRGESNLNRQLSRQERFQEMFCTYPKVKDKDQQSMTLLGRDNQTSLSISTRKEGNQWKLASFDWFDSDAAMATARRNGDKYCSGEPTIVEDVPLGSFEIGDKVTVNWNGKGTDFYHGQIVKKDPYNKHRYFIEFEKIRSEWVHAEFILQQNRTLTPEDNAGNTAAPATTTKTDNPPEQNADKPKETMQKGKKALKGLMRSLKD